MKNADGAYSETNNLIDSVLSCIGQFRYLFDYMKLCKPIINNFQETEILNAYKIVEVKEAVDYIMKISNSVLDTCNEVTSQLENHSGNVFEVNLVDSLVEYDPGKRTKIMSDNLRQYLLTLELHQPKLNL